MLNPLIQLAKSNPMMSQIKQMMGMINSAGNPQAMMNHMLTSNPQFKQVMDLINQSGGDPRKAFYALAEQKGIDPNDILSMMK